jgi:hypothetical protein
MPSLEGATSVAVRKLRSPKGVRIGSSVGAPQFLWTGLRGVCGIPKPFVNLLTLRDRSMKRHKMPPLLSVARLSLTKRSVALRPRLAAGLPLSRRRSARVHGNNHTSSMVCNIYATWPFIPSQGRKEGQGPNPRSPGDLHQHHRANPSYAAALDEVLMSGKDLR